MQREDHYQGGEEIPTSQGSGDISQTHAQPGLTWLCRSVTLSLQSLMRRSSSVHVIRDDQPQGTPHEPQIPHKDAGCP